MLHLRCSVFAAVICFPALAFAHYPWFLKGQPADKPGTVTMIFEEGPAPGNGEYLDPFIKSATYWLRTTEKNAPTPLEFKPHDKDGKRWLTFSPDAVPAHGIEGYCKWGVYQGKLLHYYVRYLNVTSPEHLAALARAEKLQFDLVPRIEQNEIVVQVLWEGKPAAEKPVYITGPQFRRTATADAQGLIRFQPEKAGLYTLRSQFVQPEPEGTDDGTAYKGMRQTVTLTLNLPVSGSAEPAK
jgi:hypothetical protein